MSDWHDRLRSMAGPFGPDQLRRSADLFAPLLPPVDETGVRRDLIYGPDPRHRLDVFGHPDGGARPALVFIHGGGFIAGDKGAVGLPYYANVGAWAVRRGWVGIAATYRLAPAHRWPAGADDVARIIDWLHAEAPTLGIDPRRIVLMGQSAGAAHVAAYVGHPRFRGRSDAMLAGAAMLSGIYDPATAEPNPFQTAYYGIDGTDDLAGMSALDGLADSPLPLLYTVAENDPADFQRQAAALVARYVDRSGRWPDIRRLAAHNHITPVHAIGSSADDVGPIVAAFAAAAAVA